MAHFTLFWHGVNLDLTCIGLYGKWSLYQLTNTCVCYHKNTQQLWQNRQKYPRLAQRQSICYVHKASDLCTLHEQNSLIHLRSITTNIHNLWNNGHKSYILHRDKVHFTCIKSRLGLITVPNMNKINQLISEISQEIEEQYCHNYSNLAYSRWYCMCISKI